MSEAMQSIVVLKPLLFGFVVMLTIIASTLSLFGREQDDPKVTRLLLLAIAWGVVMNALP